MRLAFALALALIVSGTARAATPFDLYEQGKYDAAIAAGVAQDNAAGFAIAARAELAAETMRATRCLECIQRAQRYARKAIAADPKNADGHVFLAVALGREGRLLSSFTVLRKGYPSQAKAELDAAIDADPKSTFAWSALGGWNVEIVHKGGARPARLMYGASLDDGLAAFQKAFALAPGNIGVRYQYALTLSAYDVDAYRAQIDDALARAQNGKANGVYEVFVQARAKELREALKKGDMDAYAALVARDQGNPQ
jgi:tetratricopeptide (TPR) repeat protein